MDKTPAVALLTGRPAQRKQQELVPFRQHDTIEPCGVACSSRVLFHGFPQQPTYRCTRNCLCVIISTLAYIGLRNSGRDFLERSGWTEAARIATRRTIVDTLKPFIWTRSGTKSGRQRAARARPSKDRMLQDRTQQLRQATRQRDLLQKDLADCSVVSIS